MWTTVCTIHLQEDIDVKLTDDQMKALFNRVDTDKNGSVTKQGTKLIQGQFCNYSLQIKISFYPKFCCFFCRICRKF